MGPLVKISQPVWSMRLECRERSRESADRSAGIGWLNLDFRVISSRTQDDAGAGMDDGRSEGSSERPKFFSNATAWLGGITGLIVAVTGLVAVWPRAKPSEPVKAEAALVDPAAEEAATDDEAVDTTARPLPLKYKAVGATFEKVDGEWVYISASEETRYKEVSRQGGNTVVFDPKREVYARWPNQGGKVEEKGSDDQAEWEDSFDIWVPKAAQPDE